MLDVEDRDNSPEHTTRPPVATSDEISILDYWRVLYKYHRMILGLTLLAVLITVGVSFLRPRVYIATSAIVPPIDLLQRESGLSGRLTGGTQSWLRSMVDTTGVADMYVGILRSRTVSDKVIDRFNLLKTYNRVRDRVGARKELERNTSVKVGREGIVQVSVSDTDPNRAAAVANAYVEELDQQNKRLSSGQATSKRLFLENRLAEMREELSKIETLRAREAQIKEMIFETLTREYELAKMEEAKSMPTIQVLDRAIIPERPLGRGIVKISLLTGMIVLLFSVLVAFAREYVDSRSQ